MVRNLGDRGRTILFHNILKAGALLPSHSVMLKLLKKLNMPHNVGLICN